MGLVSSSLFNQTFGTDGLKLNAFYYFPNSMLVEVLKVLFYITMPCGIIICLISNATEIENIPWINKQIKKRDGFIDRKMLLALRLCTTFTMMFFTFLIDDEFILMIFVGLVATPFIGFVVPVL